MDNRRVAAMMRLAMRGRRGMAADMLSVHRPEHGTDVLPALVILFGEPWDRNPRLFDPLFDRYKIKRSDDPMTLKRLIHAMASKHERGFRPGRGRRRSQHITPTQWQNLLLYCYVNGDPQRAKQGANAILSRIAEKIATQRSTVKLPAIQGRYNRGKETFARYCAGDPDALKELRIETIRKIVEGSVGKDAKCLAAFVQGKLPDLLR